MTTGVSLGGVCGLGTRLHWGELGLVEAQDALGAVLIEGQLAFLWHPLNQGHHIWLDGVMDLCVCVCVLCV